MKPSLALLLAVPSPAGAAVTAGAPDGAGTRITMVYRVAGNSSAKLDTLATPVDAVMADGFARLTRFSATGTADQPRD